MKVYKKQPKFSPILIELETEKEFSIVQRLIHFSNALQISTADLDQSEVQIALNKFHDALIKLMHC